MPKSKRNKQVELSKTKKHGLEGKKQLYSVVRSCADSYSNLYIFSVNDMRNAKMKNVREQWKDSRFFIGKNKVMAMALGRTEEEEYKPNLHKIGERLHGERGLLFTNRSAEEVIQWFQIHTESDFARSGNIATQDVHLSEGPLTEFPHSLEAYLRQLGLPTTLQKGVVHLVKDHEVCKEGDILSPETAKILKLLGYEMAEFQVKIECVWSSDGSFQVLCPESETLKETKKATPKKRKISDTMEVDQVEDMDLDEGNKAEAEEPVSKKLRPEEVVESEDEESEDEENIEIDNLADKNSQDEAKESPVIVEVEDDESEDGESIEIGDKLVDKNSQDEAKESAISKKLNGEAEELESDDQENVPIDDNVVIEEPSQDSSKSENEEKQVEAVEEVPDKEAILKMTEKKLEDSAKKPTKFSPKMTRARAAAAANKATGASKNKDTASAKGSVANKKKTAVKSNKSSSELSKSVRTPRGKKA